MAPSSQMGQRHRVDSRPETAYSNASSSATARPSRRSQTGTFTLDPPSIAANTKAGVTVTPADVAAGDLVVVEPPSDLEDDLIPAGVVAGAGQFTRKRQEPEFGELVGYS